MVITLNKPNKIISMHRNECNIVRDKVGNIDLKQYKDGYKTSENQVWFSEENFSLEKAREFFGDIDYCKVFCQRCFKD